MKAEINNENKAKFFALYWGQEVYGWEDGSTTGFVSLNVNETEFLILKPLSSISDEDIIKLYKLVTPEDNGWIVGKSTEYRRDWLKRFKYQQNLSSDIVDFIRSIGVAYRWMGLSVEEIVEAGWIKLTT
jgi:hypothetical protein